MTMTLTDLLLHEAEVTYALTEKLFHRVGDSDLSWAPATGTNWMTIGQLMMHCASFGCGKAVQGFVKGDWGLPAGTHLEDLGEDDHLPPAVALPSVATIQEALDRLATDRNLTLSGIANAGELALMDRRVSAPWGGPTFTLFQHLLHMIDHLAQHKGQLFYYLKLMGKDVGTCDLWGE
jgi:hypothetical protein